MKIIGISAPAGAGKDTLASMLTARHDVWIGGRWVDVRFEIARETMHLASILDGPKLPSGGSVYFTRAAVAHNASSEYRDNGRGVTLAFADPMKAALRDWYGFSYRDLWGPSAERNKAQAVAGGLSIRTLLQTLGTEWGRAGHSSIWTETHDRTVAHWAEDFNEPEVVVIPDMRFANEARRVRDLGGCVVALNGRGGLTGAAQAHSSEQEQAEAEFQAQVTHRYCNDRSFHDLRRFAHKLMET